MALNHDVWLEYTIDDDGIWAFCPERINGCFFRKNLGHTPTCDDVVNATREHAQEVSDNE